MTHIITKLTQFYTESHRLKSIDTPGNCAGPATVAADAAVAAFSGLCTRQ